MPALGPLPFAAAKHAKYQTELSLFLVAEHATQLAAHLQQMTPTKGVTLSPLSLKAKDPAYGDQWTLYWKVQTATGPSRLLLAHPNKDEWVATLSLDAPMLQQVTQALAAQVARGTIRIETLGALHWSSNFHLVFELEP